MVSCARAERHGRHRPQGWRASRGSGEPCSTTDGRAKPGVEGQPLELGCKSPMERKGCRGWVMNRVTTETGGQAVDGRSMPGPQVCNPGPFVGCLRGNASIFGTCSRSRLLISLPMAGEGGNAWRGAAHGMDGWGFTSRSLTLVQPNCENIQHSIIQVIYYKMVLQSMGRCSVCIRENEKPTR